MKHLVQILIFILMMNAGFVTAQDTIPPKIKLIGPPAINVCRWDIYIDEGYTVSDNIDSSYQIIVDTSGTFKDTNLEGIYTIIYSSTDRAGNNSSVMRVIYVRNPYEFPCSWEPPKDTVPPTNSISEIALNNSISIYPNPATHQIQINATSQIKNIAIYGMSGKCLMNAFPKYDNPAIMDVKHFPQGLYMVKVETRNEIFYEKLLISR